MANAQVLIVGAGPTGLVLALGLQRQGVPFRIIEKNPGPGTASRAMVVQARTLEFYRQLGIAEDVIANGIKIDKGRFRSEGKDVATFDFSHLGDGLSPYPFVLCYAQDDHERFLVQKLKERGVQVEWNTELKGFTQDENFVTATLTADGRESEARFAYLCGCDGAHSRTREIMGVALPGGTYEQLFYVADVKTSADSSAALNFNLSARNLCLKLPVRSTGMQRLIGTMPAALAKAANRGFEDVRGEVEPLLGVKVEEVNWFSTYRVHHRVADRFQKGRAFLVGDAGHIHSPAGGQGMNTGIGDAFNLAWKMAMVLKEQANPKILDTYEIERIAFARTLVKSTDLAFRQAVNGGIAGRFVRSILMPKLLPFAIGFSGARKLIFRTLSQIWIHYPVSPLSVGESGEVHGGDRLPWIPALDNHSSLKGMNWQLHVYGVANPETLRFAQRRGLRLFVFPWTEQANQAGFVRDTAVLVRPDGYVGFVTGNQDMTETASYLDGFGLYAPQSNSTVRYFRDSEMPETRLN